VWLRSRHRTLVGRPANISVLAGLAPFWKSKCGQVIASGVPNLGPISRWDKWVSLLRTSPLHNGVIASHRNSVLTFH